MTAKHYGVVDGIANAEPDGATGNLSISSVLADSVAEDLERWRNCFICLECGRGAVDEDGCCTTCGRDSLLIIDGKIANTSIAAHIDALEDNDQKLRAELAEARMLARDAQIQSKDQDAAFQDARHELAIVNELLVAATKDDAGMALRGVAADAMRERDKLKTELAEAHEALTTANRERDRLKAESELSHHATIAFLFDRAEQYDNSSRYRAFADELIAGIAERRHVQCAEAGEYDDMRGRISRILAAHAPKTEADRG